MAVRVERLKGGAVKEGRKPNNGLVRIYLIVSSRSLIHSSVHPSSDLYPVVMHDPGIARQGIRPARSLLRLRGACRRVSGRRYSSADPCSLLPPPFRAVAGRHPHPPHAIVHQDGHLALRDGYG